MGAPTPGEEPERPEGYYEAELEVLQEAAVEGQVDLDTENIQYVPPCDKCAEAKRDCIKWKARGGTACDWCSVKKERCSRVGGPERKRKRKGK